MEWVEEALSAGLAWGRMGGWMKSRRKGIVAMIKVVDGFIFMLEERWCAGQEASADVSTGHSKVATGASLRALHSD